MEAMRNDACEPLLRLPAPRQPVGRFLVGPLLRAAQRLLGPGLTEAEAVVQRRGTVPVPRSPAPRVARERLSAEIRRLSFRQLLVEKGAFALYRARANQIPATLEEIGRLRGAAFRATWEGAGAPVDLDRFDEYYTHLFVWDRGREALVGACRLGRTDEILEQRGLQGLYTATLFQYQRSLFERIGPALEFGRFFVRDDYLRSLQPLTLLWKGMGRYVAQIPRYRAFFGAVSIRQDCGAASREGMTRALKHTHRDDLSRFVRARRPLQTANLSRWDGSWGCQPPARRVSELEGSEKGVPAFLRPYLKLGGRPLGFSEDPNFRNALDCLVLVDLANMPRRMLERYLGPEPAAAFLAFQGLAAQARAAA